MVLQTFVARCSCGRVVLEADGPPMVHICCYCDDCQAAAALIDALPGGRSGMEKDGGTPNILFRKDRVRVTEGAELLEGYRVRPKSWTARLVASCCNTAMTQVHENWWPHRGIKTALFTQPVPPIDMRIFTKFAPHPEALPGDVPSYRTISPGFALTLLTNATALRLRGQHRSGAIRYSPA